MSDASSLDSRSDEITGISDKSDRSTVKPEGGAQAHEDFARAFEYLEMLGIPAVDAKRALEATISHQAPDSVRSDSPTLLVFMKCAVTLQLRQVG